MINTKDLIDLTPEEKKKYKKMPIDKIIKEVMERSKVTEKESTFASVWIKNRSMK